jgi:hypothetical protein
VRGRVRAICEALLASGIRDDQGRPDPEQTFWVQASLAEALLGTGETTQANLLRAAIAASAPKPSMAATMNEQLDTLGALLAAAPPVAR